MIKTRGGFGELVVAAFTGSTTMSVSRLVHDYGSFQEVSSLQDKESTVSYYIVSRQWCYAENEEMDDVNERRGLLAQEEEERRHHQTVKRNGSRRTKNET
jgi:hypothetical protein